MITVKQLKEELAQMHDDSVIVAFDEDNNACAVEVIHFCHDRILLGADIDNCIKRKDRTTEGAYAYLVIGLLDGYDKMETW